MKFSLFASSFLFVASVSLAGNPEPVAAAEWDLDPFSWAASDAGSVISFGESLVKGGWDEPLAETIELRARIVPEKANCPEWSSVGIVAYSNDENYWALQLGKKPDSKGNKTFCELKAMVSGVWGAESTLPRTGDNTGKAWIWGRAYDLRLRVAPDRVDGEIVDADTGETLFRTSFAGSFRATRPALRVVGMMESRVSEFTVAADGLVPGVAPSDELPPYIPSGPETGLYGSATGFFHIETIEGCDWPIDPTGRAVILAGCNHVKPQGIFSDALGYSRYGRFVTTNYPSREAWADETLGRLADWGFTLIGNAGNLPLLAHKALPHIRNIQLGQRVSRGDPDRYICEWRFAPCSALPNVFHPGFAAACEWRARERCAPSKDDPWLVGYFIDNELAWWGHRTSMLATGLYEATAALPSSHSARQELDRFLAERGKAVDGGGARLPLAEDKIDFLRHYARTYYTITAAAIRKADPNHMILGSRYAGLTGAHPVVWEEAGRVSDIVTFNCYPWADLDRGIVLDDKGGVPMTERLREYWGYARKPLMITEWSFPSIDASPCYVGAGQRVRTQAERAEATSLFARTMLADPHVAGYDYFMWVDEPAEGGSRWNPEDCNYGLIAEDGRPWPEITEVFRALHGDLVRWRSAPPPQPHEPPNAPKVSERDKYFAAAARSAAGAGATAGESDSPVEVGEDNGAWYLRNGKVSLSGRVGSAVLADKISFGGEPVGRWGALVACRDGGTNIWVDVSRLDSVSIARDAATGVASVTLRGTGELPGGRPFAISNRLSLAPGADDALAEIVSFENPGAEPIEVKALYMRPFPRKGAADVIPQVQKLWKAPADAAWKLPGGGSWGLRSEDAAALPFRFWVHRVNGTVHPDAAFAPGGLSKALFSVAPGQVWMPDEPMSALIFRRNTHSTKGLL